MLPGEISNYYAMKEFYQWVHVVGKFCSKVKPEFPLTPMNNLGKETKEILNQSRWLILRIDFTNK